jgi:peptidoglycan/xylan/chitin deacetylase (PgdA/CDA1 family)
MRKVVGGLVFAGLSLAGSDAIQFIEKTEYLNHAKAVVTHSLDDASKYVPQCLDILNQYGIKATIFVDTRWMLMSELWPRLRRAIEEGHEVGSHSRRHRCKWPTDAMFCSQAYTESEVSGSRDDILGHTQQAHVWSWSYPCGDCSGFPFAQRKLARAGYLVARDYPGERQGLQNVPDLQTWASNPYQASYTQVVQKKGGPAQNGRTDVGELNAKFDEVYGRGGIYHFMSHPMWLDYGPQQFYQQHLKHIARRKDVWYVPLGPLYAYRTGREHVQVSRLATGGAKARFTVRYDLDPDVFPSSITLRFRAAETVAVFADGRRVAEKGEGPTVGWTGEYWRRGSGDGGDVYVTVAPGVVVEFR